MATHAEIERILEWATEWYKPEPCPLTRDDIRGICRGPMKDVLLEFLVPRFRTDEEIKVIRSNLYLNDVVSNRFKDGTSNLGSDEIKKDEEEIAKLNGQLEKIQEEKEDVVRQISKGYGRVQDNNLQLGKRVQKDLAHLEELKFHQELMAHRVSSTASLLVDMSNAQIPGSTHQNANPVSAGELSKPEATPTAITQLKGLYDKSSNLFDMMFLRPSLSHSDTLSSPIEDEITSMTSQISDQTHELTQFGIKPDLVDRWSRREQEAAAHLLAKVEQKCSNVMDPLEALTKEAEMLHIKLMKAHVDIHFRTRELNSEFKKVYELRKNKIHNVVLTDTSVVPQDLLSFIQREEQLKKLLKCRELTKQFKELAENYRGEDLLTVLSGETPHPNGLTEDSKGGSEEKGDRTSLGINDTKFNAINKEVLEDLTISFLKNFPEEKDKLQSAVTQCHNLVMEKFPKLSIGELDSLNNKLKLTDGKDHLESITIELSPEVYKQGILATLSSVPTINERSQRDSLNELIALHNNLQETIAQCKTEFLQKT